MSTAKDLVTQAFRQMNDLPYVEGMTASDAFLSTEAGRYMGLLASAAIGLIHDVQIGEDWRCEACGNYPDTPHHEYGCPLGRAQSVAVP